MEEIKLIDEKQLNILLSLKGGKGAQLVNDLIDMFEEHVPICIASLKDEILKNDREQIEHFSHKLKGSCANIGANRLRYIAENMEKLAKENQVDDFSERLDVVEKEYVETIQVLRSDWYK